MNTEKLYEFLILSQTLNYSQASKTLYISQSVLSKHIQSLEEELQTALFERNTHGVSLTPAGKLLAREANGLLDSCGKAAGVLRQQTFSMQGIIRIACALELSYSAHIQIFIERFTERYPKINTQSVILSEGTPASVLADYDLVFTPCEYPNLPSTVKSRLLQNHGTYAVLYPGHALLSKYMIQLKEMENETIIVPFSHELFGPYAKNYQLIKKYTRNQVGFLPAENLSTALFLVSLGKGIAVIPRYAKNLLHTNLLTVGINSVSCCFPEYLYYSERNNNAAELFFKEFCDTLTVL